MNGILSPLFCSISLHTYHSHTSSFLFSLLLLLSFLLSSLSLSLPLSLVSSTSQSFG
jgi:hypothetical protein